MREHFMSDDDFTDIPEHRETCECLHTHICQPTTCKRILVLALSMQNATASVSLQVLHEPRLYQNYRRNLLAIQSSLDSTNKRQCSHIHEFLEEGCAALSYNTRYYLFLFYVEWWYMWLRYMRYAHMYLCVWCVYVVLSFILGFGLWSRSLDIYASIPR